MVTTLAICLDAPLQSWGTVSRFTHRDTAREPTKSGVVGLLGAALGMPRDDRERIDELSQLRLGIREDRPGLLHRDFQTIRGIPSTEGGKLGNQISERYSLADAVFLVVLQGDSQLLSVIAEALHQPRWPLFFGRKAYPPARPLLRPTSPGSTGFLTGWGLAEMPLFDVLNTHPWLENSTKTRNSALTDLNLDRPRWLRTVCDRVEDDRATKLRHDLPLTFDRADRRHAPREVTVGEIPLTRSLIHG